MSPRPPIPSPAATCHDTCHPSPPPPHHPRHVANILLISAAIAAAVLLLSLTYYAVLRRRRRPTVAAVSGGASGESPAHHVWLVRTVGLDDVAIEAIGVEEYNKAGEEVANDCAVCLAEFDDGELVRLLPKCRHAFHVACIDPWLRAHVNCPLCRARILDPVDNSVNLGETTEMPPTETVELGDESENNQEELDDMMEIRIRVSSDVREESELSPESLSSGSAEVRSVVGSGMTVGDGAVTEGGVSGSEGERDLECGDGNVGKSREKSGNTSKEGLDGKANSEMERSLSSGARGFFFSRH